MQSHFHSSLRARLIQLVLLAVLPALGVIVYSAGEQRITDSQEARRDALKLVRIVSTSQQRLIDSTQHLLVALSLLPEVRAHNSSTCSDLFSSLLAEYPMYANLGAANVHGEQFCGARLAKMPVNISDRSYFRQALQRRNFAIGEYQIGRATDRATLNLAYPIRATEGRVTGVVFAALDLAWFQQTVGALNLPSYASLAVYDRRGTILARYPDADRLVGKPVPEGELAQIVSARSEGVVEAAGPDGQRRIYGFTSIGDGSREGQIFFHIGVPIGVALANADGLLRRNLAALFLVSLLALLAAWYGGDAFVLGPLRRLLTVTERLRTGDLGARTGLPHRNDEIGRLANSFDEMAKFLQGRRSEAVAAEKRLERNLQRLNALHDIDMAIASTLDLHAVLKILMEKVDLVLPGAVATIRLISKESGKLEAVACRNLDETEWRAANSGSLHEFAKIVLENKIPLTVANVQTDPRNDKRQFAKHFGLVSYLGIPLVAKDQLLGLIAFYTKEEHAFNDDEIEFLSTLAGQSAIAIQNAKLYEETRRSEVEISALHTLTVAATQSLDLDVVLHQTIQKITQLFHFDLTRVFLFNAEMTELGVKAAFEARPEFWREASYFRRGESLVGQVAETGQAFVSADIALDPRYWEMSGNHGASQAGAHFLAMFPIKTKLRTWGVLVCAGTLPRLLKANEINLLESMNNQIGIAVENSTLYQQTAAKAKELATLYSVAGIASESLDINVVLKKTMEKLLVIFNFDAARIYLCNEDSGDLHLVTHYGIPPGVPLVAVYKAGEGHLGRAIETGEAMYVDDMATDTLYNKLAHNKNMLKAGFHSSFLIPLRVRGEGLGVMNFLGKERYHFSEADIQLINAIAYHLGVAVGNARLFSQVNKKTIELETASRGKDEFLGVISHELRTPLNVIKGYTEIMMQGVLGEITPEQKKAVETISNQSMELFNMISGVLQVTRIEADAVHAASWEVNLAELLDELRSNYGIPLGRDLTVSWDYPADLPILWTDDEKLKAVIQNLINNAIKFTEKGKVTVAVRHLAQTRAIEFKISDTGIGIPKEKVETIFDMFQQVDSSATRKFGGVGLGLYIVRKFTELLGGTVAVESEFEQGSTFTVTLPIQAAAPGQPKRKREPLRDGAPDF